MRGSRSTLTQLPAVPKETELKAKSHSQYSDSSLKLSLQPASSLCKQLAAHCFTLHMLEFH